MKIPRFQNHIKASLIYVLLCFYGYTFPYLNLYCNLHCLHVVIHPTACSSGSEALFWFSCVFPVFAETAKRPGNTTIGQLIVFLSHSEDIHRNKCALFLTYSCLYLYSTTDQDHPEFQDRPDQKEWEDSQWVWCKHILALHECVRFALKMSIFLSSSELKGTPGERGSAGVPGLMVRWSNGMSLISTFQQNGCHRAYL